MPVNTAAPVIAIVGCGAIAELFHLPAFARHEEVARRLILVDADQARAAALAAKVPGSRTAASLESVLGEIQGAVLAVPHHLHVPMSLTCAGAGVHVLCEKPLADRAAEVDAIAAAAAQSGATVAVNNMRRFYPAVKEIHRLVRAGELGTLKRLTITWGEKFDWGAASGFYFGQASRGRGALLDRGAHVLDLACWWLGGPIRLTGYRDDSLGGAECWAELMGEREGCAVEVRMSWLSRFENRIVLEGDAGGVGLGIYDWVEFQRWSPRGQPRKVVMPSTLTAPREISRLVADSFLATIREGAPPVVSARDVRDSIALMEAAYQARTRVAMPWFDAWERYGDVARA